MILIIDNYDSFTYNLVQYCGKLGAAIKVVRNDAITVDEIVTLNKGNKNNQDNQNNAPEKIIISPGPCTPDQAGISLQVIEKFAGVIPILGVCLGHQALAQCFGGKIINAKQIMHGKTSLIYHNNTSVFENLPMPFTATRYHSLVVELDSLPDCFEITAWTEDSEGEINEIMGIKHITLDVAGVQFHPESILTQSGHELLGNFLGLNK